MIKRINTKQLTDLSHSILQTFYGCASTCIPDYLHSDIVWIDSMNGLFLYGYYNVVSSLSKLPRPVSAHADIRHSHLTLLSSGICTVACEYILLTGSPDILPPQKHCSSFVWQYLSHSFKLVCVHLSSCFPGHRTAPALTFSGIHAEVYRIAPEEILYIEAANTHSLFFCRDGQLTVNRSISSLADLLPPCFMRIHRCFIVNKQYVRRIYRCGLELSNGTHVPVPEKRYMQVVCWIEN